jgi:hypothetical protein
MNLASTIRALNEKKETPPFDVSKADYASAAKELTAYAKKSGGIDKDDMLSIANRMAEIGKKKSPKVMAKMVTMLQDMDTDPRDKVIEIMGKHGIKVKVSGKGFQVEERTLEEWTALIEAPEDNEPASPDEGSMATKQLEFIAYAAEEIEEHLENGGNFPEWMQNKLTEAHTTMEDLHSSIGDHGGDDEMQEAYTKQQLMKMRQMLGREGQADKKKGIAIFMDKVGVDKSRATAMWKAAMNEEVELDEAKKEVTPKDVEDYLVKTGVNPKDAKDAVKKGFGYASKKYGGPTFKSAVKKIADVIWSLHEEVELDEAKRDPSKSGGSGYDLYHKDFSSAMQHAYKYAKEKLGIEIDPKEIDDKVASGPRKPSSGKTNSYRLTDKSGKKAVQIQVANLDNKKYELNMYKEEVEMDVNEAFEVMFEETEYQKFFKSALKKFGVSSPSELDGEKEKEFYDYVDKNWKGKDEKPEAGEKSESLSLNDTFKAIFEASKSKTEEIDDEISDEEDEPKGAEDEEPKKKKAKKKDAEVEDEEGEEEDEMEESLSLEDTFKRIMFGEASTKKEQDHEEPDADDEGGPSDNDADNEKEKEAPKKKMPPKKEPKEDDTYKDVGKSGKQTKVDVNPDLDEEAGEPMSSAEKEKRDEIMKSLEKKKQEFVDKYGDRAKEVMARTAIKMAKKHA